MSETDITEIRFLLGIRLWHDSNGIKDKEVQISDEGMPKEVVIMQIKSYLKELENDYFKDFNQRNSN